jgi:hypothetical protein
MLSASKVAMADKPSESYWLKVWTTDRLEEAKAMAAKVNPNWIEGGRLTQVFIKRTQQEPGSMGSRYKVYLGAYPDLIQTVRVAVQVLELQPWKKLGIICPRVQIVSSGTFAPIHLSFNQALVDSLRSGEEAEMPMLAQSTVARGYGFAAPSPTVPAFSKSTAKIEAWQKAIVFREETECAETRKLVGGPPPRRPGSRAGPRPLQVHPAGKRCLRWLYALTERPLALAWFPAPYLVDVSSMKKARTTSRWGPVTYRYTMTRIGESPEGVVYHAVFRTGAFPPIIKRVVVPRKYPEPHRLVFDKLGAAIYEGKGRVVERLLIKPPPPKIPVLWRKKKSKGPTRSVPTPRK